MNELKQAGADLDGNQRYQTAREELEGLLESVREKDSQDELIAQAESLLSSQTPTPQAFADMKEKLNKKLAPAEESHHVGSMDPNEVAPTVEALPELVIETETTAFERQERPNAELLKGQRQLVQAGAEGQVRRLVEVDAQGNRTLRSTEVLKEALPEITEVGTKVLSSNQPSEGVKDLVLANPKLEIEEDTVVFNRQERPNASLLKGQRQLVQKGEEGQIRRLVEVDAQGKRTLRSTEVLKEAIPEITEVGTKVLSSNQPAEGVKDLVLEIPKLEIEEDTVDFEHQERQNVDLLKGQRQLVQKGEEGQIRRLVEVDVQGKRILRSTEVLKEAIPEITEVGTKEVAPSSDKPHADTLSKEQKGLPATPSTNAPTAEVLVKGEVASKQLPNTGVETDASLVALGLLGVMSGYGLLSRKRRED